MTTNLQRQAYALRAASAYRAAGAGDPEDRAGTLGDLLTDLLHLIYAEAADDADEARTEVERLHARAWRNFVAELADEAREAADVAAMDAERALSRAGASAPVAGVQGADVQNALAEIGVQLESAEQYELVARLLRREWVNVHAPDCPVTTERAALVADLERDPSSAHLRGAVREYDLGGDQEAEGCTCGAYLPGRLEYLRGELRAERLSYGDLVELQNYGQAGWIPADDLELREAAGLPESPYVNQDALHAETVDGLVSLIAEGGPWDLVQAMRAELARRLRAAEADGDMDAVAEVENALAGLLGLDAEQGLTEADGAAISAFRDAHDPEPLSFDTMGEDELRQLAKDLYALLSTEQLLQFHSERVPS